MEQPGHHRRLPVISATSGVIAAVCLASVFVVSPLLAGVPSTASAFVVGIQMMLGLIASVVAVVSGHASRGRAQSTDGSQGATIGLVFGYGYVAVLLLAIAAWLLYVLNHLK